MATRRKLKTPPDVTGKDIIVWIQKHCKIPEGRDVGKPVKLRRFQREIIEGIYDRPTRRVIISFGRKNAKTTLAAFLLLVHLCGPKAKPNSHLFSAAQSRDQASILFGLAAKIVRMSDLGDHVIIRDTAKELVCRELGTHYKALSADASTAYGLSPVFIVHDELGQVQGPRSALYEALETATAAQEEPLSIIISTQAPTDADLLSILIDDAKAKGDDRVRLFLYSADPELDAFSEEAIRQANPAFGDFQNAEEVLAMAEDARRMPSRQSEFENLVLNRRVEMSSPFISRKVWMDCVGDLTDFSGLPVYGGLDLSATADLTALVLIAPFQGKWHLRPTFWLPGEGLREKSQHDHVPYDVWAQQGFLKTTPGNTVEYEFVAEYLCHLFEDLDIRKIGFDDWNWKHFKPWLAKSGLPEDLIEDRFLPIRQNYKDISPALRSLEVAIKEHKLVHDAHPVLSMCAHNAVVVSDGKENRMLTKLKSRGRIDGMVALAMAMSVAGTYVEEVKVNINDFLRNAVVA